MPGGPEGPDKDIVGPFPKAQTGVGLNIQCQEDGVSLIKWTRGIVLFLLLVVAALGPSTGDAYAENATLIIGSAAEASGLDPRMATDVYSFERIHTIMEPLVSFATDMSLAPRLARGWETSDDGMQLTFYLEEGVLFHHGREFTAEDVKYTFEWVVDENNVSLNRPLYTDIESVEVVDDYTVVFHLKAPNGFLINNIARMPIVPFDKGDDPDFDRHPSGTGPYVFESWRRDDRMVVRAFADYWGPKAKVERIEFRPIPESAAKLLAFEAGEIDLFQGGIVPDEVPRIEGDSRFKVQRVPGVGYTYLGFNLNSGALADKRVRQAISHLINREGIVDVVLNGIGRPGVSMIAPQLPWFNPDVRRYDYDPDTAKALLAESGYSPEELTFRFHVSESPTNMLLAEIIEFELAQVGVTARVIVEEFGAFLDRIELTDDYDMFILGWSGQVDPDRAMSRQFHTDGSQNDTNFSHPRVDELLDLGRITPADSPASIEIYAEAQAIVVEEAPLAFINYSEEVGMMQRHVDGWSVHPHGSATYQDAHLITKNK